MPTGNQSASYSARYLLQHEQLTPVMEVETANVTSSLWGWGSSNSSDGYFYTNGTSECLNDTNVTSSSSWQPSHELRFICETVINMPIALLGILGNILAFIILWRQKQRLSTTLLLQGLAVSDTSVLVATVLLRSIRYLYVYTKADWLVPFNDVYPYIFRWVFPCVFFLRLAGSWLTVLLTIDRYIAVRHPLHAQRLCTLPKAIKNMVILSLLALLFCLPRFFEHEIDSSNVHGFISTPLLLNKYYTVIYRIFLYLLFMYLLPMILLVVLNAKLLCTLREADSYRANVTEWRISRSNRSITAIVVTVVLVTIVCNLTAMAAHLVWSVEQGFPALKGAETTRRCLALISNIFVTINSAVNFIIYCLCSRNFRVALARICRCYTVRMRLRRSSKQSSSRTTYISLGHNSFLKRKPQNVPVVVQHGV